VPIAAFREIERALSLADGFVLSPVECGPDVARTMAEWLDEKGWPTRVLEPVSDDAWRELVSGLLEAAASPARVVVVIGSRQPSPGVSAALRLVNQRRDAIVEALDKTLLWCGPPEFLKLTWERAPDFWSVRAMTRKLSTSTAPWREAPLWPGAWPADPPERLREMLAMATAQGEAGIASHAAAMLAESLAARGEIDEAAEVVTEAPPAPELRLVGAFLAALRGDPDRAEAMLREASPGDDSPELEGRRLVALGNLELERDKTAAMQLYEQAARILGAARDTPNVAVALADMGLVAMTDGAFDVAEDRLEEAVAVARRAGDARNEALILSKLGRLHLLRHDSRRACATLEEALARANDAGDRRSEGEVLRRLARAYLELGDPEKAEEDAERAAAIAGAVGDGDGAREASEIAREARDAARG
jgi:tetratricopeptide (TPR) repeat protein